MKLIFQNSKSKQFVTLEVDPKATLEDVRNELHTKHNFIEGDYQFIHIGKILKNPTPFSSIEENSKIIVYIKPQNKQPPPSQTPPPPASEQPRLQHGQPNQRQVSIEEAIQIISPILRSAMSVNLVEKAYQPENDFYNHPKEVNEIRQMIDETSNTLISEFILRHFQITLRSLNLSPERVMAMIGHNLPEIRHIITDFDASFMELSKAQQNIVNMLISQLEDKFDRKTILDTFIACDCKEAETRECLNQMK